MKATALLALVMLGLLSAGCGSGADGKSTAPLNHSATSTAAAISTTPFVKDVDAAPKQQNGTGLPEVTYDPCMQINDAAVSAMGFDPASRRRQNAVGDVYSRLSCLFHSPDRGLAISAFNSPYNEEQELYSKYYESTAINGRESMMGTSRVDKQGCTVEMRASFGVVIVDTTNGSTPAAHAMGPCDGVVQIAELIERTIRKGQ